MNILTDTINYLIDEGIMNNAVGLAIIIVSFLVLVFGLRKYFFSRFKNLEQRLQLMEKEFEIIRERSRSNLQVYRKVVDGLGEIVNHMKTSVEEEERKIALIKINEQDTIEHIERMAKQQVD